ncbi:MAG: single-stranded-DNA-specific exonuclease RecJ [Firmicutes bacterium]|nr:single-stranded-DNA-specific exonuclease RecJ [Bacillota bacterium]
MKLIKKEWGVDKSHLAAHPSSEERSKIKTLAKQCGISEIAANVLYLRGFCTEQAIQEFVFGKGVDFFDPLLLKGMDTLVHMLTQAKNQGKQVLVWGDYDCDGVCSAAILKKVFVQFGIADVRVHIPKRNSGYGLNQKSIDEVVGIGKPALIVTCDCGISAVSEVEYIKRLGIEIVVTDHHEPGEHLPKCTIINPKQKGCAYPDKYLCGAGVALKVAQACVGMERAQAYTDLACVATIGDMVPLVDENRHIVRQGLKQINSRFCNTGLQKIKSMVEIDTVTSGDVAYKITPRINVCGRMGDALDALILLSSEDAKEIERCAEAIVHNNEKRKLMSEQQFLEAKEILANKPGALSKRAVVLCNPAWEKGLTGILAARLKAEFGRPSFVLAGGGEKDEKATDTKSAPSILKGTARGVDGVNLYELLHHAKDTLIEFGGHKQAAGFSIYADQVEAFEQKICEYLESFDAGLFRGFVKYDLEIEAAEATVDNIVSLDALEPFGVGFERPVFAIASQSIRCTNIKNQHTSLLIDESLQAMCFGNLDDFRFQSGSFVKLALDIGLNVFNKKTSVKGICVGAEQTRLVILEDLAKASSVWVNARLGVSVGRGVVDAQTIGIEQIKDIAKPFGTLVICGTQAALEQVQAQKIKQLDSEYFLYTDNINNLSKAMVAPDLEALQLGSYDQVVFVDTHFLESTMAEIARRLGAHKKSTGLFVVSNRPYTHGLDTRREAFLSAFAAIKSESVQGKNALEVISKISQSQGINPVQIAAGLAVFADLALLSLDKTPGFGYTLAPPIKTDLHKSKVYHALVQASN